jgi:hypothetical protein
MRESIGKFDGMAMTTSETTSATLKIAKDASPRGEDAIPGVEGNPWIRVYCLIPDIEVDVVVEVEPEIVVADSEDDEDDGLSHSLSICLTHRML